MARRSLLFVVIAMVLLASALRVNNAMTFPIFGGYDAFAHFTYVWFLERSGRVPLADQGWEFFQPPLYYALMAAVWKAAGGLAPELRLRIGTTIVALLGLIPAGVAAALVRRRYPLDLPLQALAASSLLFLPMHLYSAGFVGNEGLCGVLCSLALLQAVRTAERPTVMRALVLGVALGLAMLTKFTAIVIVASAFATLSVAAQGSRRPWSIAPFLVAVVAMLAICGWYYARNVEEYGTPFRLSREKLFLARIENGQHQGRRTLGEYLLFDPGILYRPQWPRGFSLHSPLGSDQPYSALRESIPTGLYANTWFDGFGGFVLPPVTASELSRRAGQALLTLGLLPTACALFGIGVLIGHGRAKQWSYADTAVAIALAAMGSVVVYGTRSVPTQAAVKATYLMPVSAAFAYVFAIGVHRLGIVHPRVRSFATATCALLALLSSAVFAYGWIVPRGWFDTVNATAKVRNLYGVLDYAGGDLRGARKEFESAARAGWHLGYENLAALAFARGELDAAAWMLANAASRAPGQFQGRPSERAEAIAATLADYANADAVILAAADRHDDARARLQWAMERDSSIPEVHFNLGVVDLLSARQGAGSAAGLRRAGEHFQRSLELDPGFREAVGMLGVAKALGGDCEAARPLLDAALVLGPAPLRRWPVETGPGDLNAAGLMRHRRIETLPSALTPRVVRDACGDGSAPRRLEQPEGGARS